MRSVSASECGVRLRSVLDRYHDDLANGDWNDLIWVKARKKLQSMCQNCGLPQTDVAKLS